MNKGELKKKFTNYVFDNYDMNDSGISRKYYHSLRVMDIANDIALNESFNDSDIELSNIVGILHDYARFPQWKKYKTYSDIVSIDHGNLGVELLFDCSEIEKFNINKSYYDEVYDSIKYHNKLSISEDISVHNKLLCKLIRDADKLDIFYLYCIDKELFKQDDEEISDALRETFYKKEQVDRRFVKSKNDNIILDLSMIFDLNFDYSYKYIKKNKIMDKLWERIDDKEKFEEYFEYINKYINERID